MPMQAMQWVQRSPQTGFLSFIVIVVQGAEADAFPAADAGFGGVKVPGRHLVSAPDGVEGEGDDHLEKVDGTGLEATAGANAVGNGSSIRRASWMRSVTSSGLSMG